MYVLNRAYLPSSTNYPWEVASREVLEHGRRLLSEFADRIPSEVFERGVTVREEQAYTEDLLPKKSPFVFRFAPTCEYLAWRYHLTLPFVRYRVFRVLHRGTSAGYVIINDQPGRLIVSQCDADDPRTLAEGVLLSIVEAAGNDRAPREVLLSSCHAEMQHIFKGFGFQESRTDLPFALGSFHQPIYLPDETSEWLINYDWGDNGLRSPFLDQITNV